MWRILLHHRYVCGRHQYWIGPPDTERYGPMLWRCPEIVTAQRQHLRLIQRFGWDAIYDGVLTALMGSMGPDPRTETAASRPGGAQPRSCTRGTRRNIVHHVEVARLPLAATYLRTVGAQRVRT